MRDDDKVSVLEIIASSLFDFSMKCSPLTILGLPGPVSTV